MVIDTIANRFGPRLRRLAAAVLAILLVAAVPILIAAGLAMRTGIEVDPNPGSQGRNDVDLYQDMIAAVRSGQSYYVAVANAHRADGYPLRPFVAVRPPLSAYALSILPNETWREWSLMALTLVTLALWCRRLADVAPNRVFFALAVVLLSSGLGLTLSLVPYALHESWAAVLIALSLVVRQPNRFLPSVALGLVAALWRELSIPYLVAMAAMAWRDGQPREARAFALAVVVAGAALAAHAWAVSTVVVPGDARSPGWLTIGGWQQVLRATNYNALLLLLPAWVVAVTTPLALFGLTAARGPVGRRLALIVFGYALAFMTLGRENNHYWGVMIAPLLPLGLLYLPDAIDTCAKAVRGLSDDERSAAPEAPSQASPGGAPPATLACL